MLVGRFSGRAFLRTSSVRKFSSVPATVVGSDVPDLARRAADIAAFYPRPQSVPKPIEKGFKGWKPFAVFILANVTPLAALIYYFKHVQAEHQLALEASPPQDVNTCLDEVSRVLFSARQTFFLCGDGTDLDVMLVDPGVPESRQFTPPENAPLDPGVPESRQFTPPENAPLGLHENATYSELAGTYSEDSFPLRAIHFAVKRNSKAGDWLANGASRRSQLVYSGRAFTSARGADHVTLKGTVAEVGDDKLRQHHWRACWGATIAEGPHSEEYVLLKFMPDEVSVPTPLVDDLTLQKDYKEDQSPYWSMSNTNDVIQ